ncbi:MAG: DNA mismatch repair protein MutS [Treponemataceae bacterium]|nr:DNA mismatch repair protein MutS [Treponemataceae bacterium]
MAEITPLMEQYGAIKSQYKKEVLFFRVGDFYEMFNEDAIEVSRLLNITLTHRGEDPMCGVPFHAAKIYIARLLRLGKHVAICEQVTPPSKGKGLTERKVIEVISPGNTVEQEYLDQGANNFLASLCFVKDYVSFSYIDISTGEFYALSWLKSQNQIELSKELGRVLPRELILPISLQRDEDVNFVLNQFPNIAIDYEQDWFFQKENSYKILLKQFETNTLHSFGLTEDSPEIIPAGYLINYLSKTANAQNPDIIFPQVTDLKILTDKEYVIIDDSSRRNLEITWNLKDGTTQYTLLETLQFTQTAMGSRLLRKRLMYPLRNVNEIINRQNRITQFVENKSVLDNIRQILSHILDIERLSSRIAMERAHGKDIQALRQSLEYVFEMRNYADQLGIIEGMELDTAFQIVEKIKKAIVEDPSTSMTEGNLIKEGYSERLDELRDIQCNFTEILENYLNEEKEKTGIPNLKIKYTSTIGYYIEVTKGKLPSVPSHFVLKRALVNCDRYTTPKLDELERELLSAQDQIIELEKNLFIEFRLALISHIKYLRGIANEVAELDFTTSLAYAAIKNNWVCPEIDDSGILEIENGRHPVVEYHMESGNFVPNNSCLKDKCFALVTGPNMAGKSTYLRQNALIVLLAQIGSFVPASKARIGIVDRIFCRVGASDNLARGESTFLVEMSETALILRSATKKSLIIMDEVGRGTSTEDGLSIAWAVSEYLLNVISAKTFFATHYHELTRLNHSSLQLLCLDVLEEAGHVVFLKRIKEGATENSYGIHVAKLAGVPNPVIKRAEEILKIIQEQNPTAKNLSSELEKSQNLKKQKEIEQTYLSLFSEEEMILDEILSTNPDEITPIQALQAISRWKAKLMAK